MLRNQSKINNPLVDYYYKLKKLSYSNIIKTGRFKELLDPSAYEYYVKHKIALKWYKYFI